MAHGFAFTYTVALILVAVVLVPAFLLPRRKVSGGESSEPGSGENLSAALMH